MQTGPTWIETSDWLDGLGDRVPGWPAFKAVAASLDARLAVLEQAGASKEDFLSAWEGAARAALSGDPCFDGWNLSESAWSLAGFRPAWKDALHDRLVDAFLRPWVDAVETRFQASPDRYFRLGWKGNSRNCSWMETRTWLTVKGLIPDIRMLAIDTGDLEILDWPDAPPVYLRLTGDLREIRRLGRVPDLDLADCPHLERIVDLDARRVWRQSAPRLDTEGTWRSGVEFKCMQHRSLH